MAAILDAQEEQIEARIARMQESDAIKIKQLQDELNAEIASVIASREERVRVLRNAESIAERMGIKRPTTPRDLSPRQAMPKWSTPKSTLPIPRTGCPCTLWALMP